jgi:hypothetical protein
MSRPAPTGSKVQRGWSISSSLVPGQSNSYKEIIESTLAESRSAKSVGADGAAAKLGISPSTLDSEIKQLSVGLGDDSSRRMIAFQARLEF